MANFQWTEQSIRDYLANTEMAKYQAVPLPFGIVSEGKDRGTSFAMSMAGLDLEGKTFLDVGSNHGLMCFLAEERGAKDVLGLDRGRYVQVATTFADMRGSAAKFVDWDVDEKPISVLGQFDIVACYNLLHHVLYPFYLLGELAKATAPGGFLVLEYATPTGRYAKHEETIDEPFARQMAARPTIAVGWTDKIDGTYWSQSAVTRFMRLLGFKDENIDRMQSPMADYRKIMICHKE